MKQELNTLCDRLGFKFDSDCNCWVLGQPWHDVYLLANVERGKFRLECKVNGSMATTTIDQLEALLMTLHGWRFR